MLYQMEQLLYCRSVYHLLPVGIHAKVTSNSCKHTTPIIICLHTLMNVSSTLMVVLKFALTSLDPIAAVVGLGTH